MVGQTTSAASADASSDWKQVEAAMGRPGQVQPGDVIRFAMPRKDLHVVLDGVDIKPGLALGSCCGSDGGSAGHFSSCLPGSCFARSLLQTTGEESAVE